MHSIFLFFVRPCPLFKINYARRNAHVQKQNRWNLEMMPVVTISCKTSGEQPNKTNEEHVANNSGTPTPFVMNHFTPLPQSTPGNVVARVGWGTAGQKNTQKKLSTHTSIIFLRSFSNMARILSGSSLSNQIWCNCRFQHVTQQKFQVLS